MNVDKKTLLEDSLLLVEQNFYFLHIGAFLGKLSKTKDLTNESLFVVKKCSEDRAYYFNPDIIQELLNDAKNRRWDEISLFEYFVDFNAFRGICMAMVEAFRLENEFMEFMKERLGDEYENFYDILSFIRNVLSHNTQAEFKLNSKDFDGTLKRIRRMKRNEKVSLHFLYAKQLPEIASPEDDYGLNLSIDFGSLKEGMEFLSVISLWELFMVSELCFNLVLSFKKRYNITY